MGSTSENDGPDSGHRATEATGGPRSASGLGVRAFPFGVVKGMELDPMYGHLREHEPLCRVRLPYGADAWLVTRYEDFKTVFGDARFCRTPTATDDEPRFTPDVFPLGLVDMDPPEHTRIRGLVSKTLTARRVERLRPRIQQLTDDLVTAMLEAGPPADLMHSLARPLAVTVVCEWFGMPPDEGSRYAALFESALSTPPTADHRLGNRLADLLAFTSDLVARRRRDPADGLLDTLIQAGDEERRLSGDELTVFILTLLSAGHDTTKNEIGNFVYLLLTHLDQWGLLCRRPEAIDGAVEELLRFAPLTIGPSLPRYAKDDVHPNGGTVRAGDPVLASHSAANRDPRVFPDPERLDVTRPITPNVTFGHGIHYCVGAQLARMELRTALATLLARMPGLRLAVDADDVVWDVTLLGRGPKTLPVRW